MSGLTDVERAMLAFETRWWKYPGAREQAIWDTFAMSPTRYHQHLLALLDRPDALVAAPMVVRRLQRLRDARAQARTSCRGTLGYELPEIVRSD